MDIIGKVLVGCIAAVLLVMSGASIIMGNMDEVVANQYLNSAAEVIQESNYNSEVIEECIEMADENGYTLTVQKCGSSMPGKKQYAEMVLTYQYSLKLFGFSKEKTISKIL